jgi:hypothetical protein
VAEAIGLADLGLYVFPVKHLGKTPAGVSWPVAATRDPKVMAGWFAGDTLNVGVACGPSGIVVVDEDVAGDLDRLAEDRGEVLVPTYTVTTARGRHLYYDAPVSLDVRNGAHLGGRAVDRRGAGGYVVGPSSVHESGVEYVVALDIPRAVLPRWLAEIGAERDGEDHGGARPGGLAGVPDVIEAGQRHAVLTSYAGSLRRRDVPYDEARTLLGVVWARCAQPLGDRYSTEDAVRLLSDIYARYQPEPVAPTVTVLGDSGEPVEAIDEGAFWAARPVLTHLHDFARARRAAPWAVLGVTLARVVVATPPMVVLPPLIGGDASLNLFVAVVGASGSGKGAASAVATEALPVGHLNSIPIGSGEGLTHLFVRRTKGGIEQHATAVLSDVGEIDTITALNARQGSTLQSVLRQAYMGEQFGFAYADPAKRLVVGAHAYRLGLIVGVQPARAAGLLDDADGGTPQRFIWMPADDPGAPDVAPAAPEPWKWRPAAHPERDARNRRRLPVCDTAVTAIDAGRLARVRGEQSVLNGHALLSREKVAAALGLLEGRAEVGEEDWRLAGVVMDVSDRTRTQIEQTLLAAQRDSNHARADAEGERAVIVSDKVEAGQTRKLERRVIGIIRRSSSEGVTGAKVRKSVTAGQRPVVNDLLATLVEAGRITVEDTERLATGAGGHGRRYWCTT